MKSEKKTGTCALKYSKFRHKVKEYFIKFTKYNSEINLFLLIIQNYCNFAPHSIQFVFQYVF
jgi:hypothetical protein